MALADLLAGVYAIVDNSVAPERSHVELARAAIAGGARVLQVRAKALGARELLEVGRAVRRLTLEHGVVFILNDRVDLALLVEADGVHLGQDDFPLPVARRVLGYKLMIGVSTHDLDQARAAVLGEADYVGYGPVFPTGSKSSPYAPRGLDRLREVVRAVNVPVVAIGGLGAENFPDVLRTGACAGAFLSGIAAAPDPAAATALLVELYRRVQAHA